MILSAPARIQRMSRRRRKIAIRRWLEKDLQRFVGQPNSPFVRAQVLDVVVSKMGYSAEVAVQPHKPVDHVEVSLVVAKPAAEPATEKEE